MRQILVATLLSLYGGQLLADPASTVAVQNPVLNNSIQRFLQHKTPENRTLMFDVLNHSTYLVPLKILSGEDRYTTFSLELPRVGQCVAAFSDQQQVDAADLKNAALIDLPADELWAMLDDLQQVDCLLLNPGTDPLPLRKAMIKEIRRY